MAKALIPGLLTAATAASKYNAGIVIVPCLLSILLFEARDKRVIRTLQLGAIVADRAAAHHTHALDPRRIL